MLPWFLLPRIQPGKLKEVEGGGRCSPTLEFCLLYREWVHLYHQTALYVTTIITRGSVFLFWGTLPFSWHETDGFHAEGFAAFPAQQARGSQSCLWLIFVSSQVLWQIDQLCVIKCCRQPLFLPEIRFLCEHYCKVNISSFSLCLWSASAADPTVGIVQAVSAAQTECCRLGRVKLPYALLLRRWWLCCWEEMVSAKPQSFH